MTPGQNVFVAHDEMCTQLDPSYWDIEYKLCMGITPALCAAALDLTQIENLGSFFSFVLIILFIWIIFVCLIPVATLDIH